MKVVLASGNAHKVAEITRGLQGRVTLVTQTSLGIAAAAETGLTFVENAILKARHASAAANLPAIADDSGLEVDALNGGPGIYSARYAGDGATDAENNRKLLLALAAVPVSDRRARFRAVVVFLRHAADPFPLIASGTWHGRIVASIQGNGGFGYDPLFQPDGHAGTVAAMPAAQKDRISHRGQALRALRDLLTP